MERATEIASNSKREVLSGRIRDRPVEGGTGKTNLTGRTPGASCKGITTFKKTRVQFVRAPNGQRLRVVVRAILRHEWSTSTSEKDGGALKLKIFPGGKLRT